MTPPVKLSSAVAVALLAAAGSHAQAADRSEPTGASDAETLKGNVLVWIDATFYTEASDTATTLHAASLAAARKDAIGEVVPMKIISVTKGFVEVEPATELDCTWSQFQTTDDLARVRLFVKRADLAPVLVEPFTKTFADGSRIALRPGVALGATADGKSVLGVRGGEVVVELPATAIGHAYTPDKTKAVAAMSDREYELAPKTTVALGDRSTVLAGRAAGIERRGDTTVFSIKTRCVALDAVAPSKAVHAIDDDESSLEPSSGLAVLDLRDHDYIPAGTPLSTPSGHVIAAAAKPIYLMSAPRGKTACFDRHTRIGVVGGDAAEPTAGDDKLRLCAPSGRVIHERMRSASSANGTTGR